MKAKYLIWCSDHWLKITVIILNIEHFFFFFMLDEFYYIPVNFSGFHFKSQVLFFFVQRFQINVVN